MRGLRSGDISENGGQPDNLQPRIGKPHVNGHGVVDTGICINDDLLAHVLVPECQRAEKVVEHGAVRNGGCGARPRDLHGRGGALASRSASSIALPAAMAASRNPKKQSPAPVGVDR